MIGRSLSWDFYFIFLDSGVAHNVIVCREFQRDRRLFYSPEIIPRRPDLRPPKHLINRKIPLRAFPPPPISTHFLVDTTKQDAALLVPAGIQTRQRGFRYSVVRSPCCYCSHLAVPRCLARRLQCYPHRHRKEVGVDAAERAG